MDLEPILVSPIESFGNIFESNYRESLDKSSEKREWFDPILYSRQTKEANSLGITIYNTDECEIEWDGTKGSSGVKVYSKPIKEVPEKGYFPTFNSEIGHGIVTVDCPLLVELPNSNPYLLTAPLNSFLPNVMVVSKVLRPEEHASRIRLQLRLQIPNIRVRIYTGTPLATLFPILDPKDVAKQELKFIKESN